jgi:hypothetical protein
MRINIVGETGSAIRLRALIARDPHLVVGTRLWDVQITMSEDVVTHPVVDGIAGELAHRVVAHVGALTPSGQVLVQFAAGRIVADNQLAIVVPCDDEAEAHAVEHGIYRGLLDFAGAPAPARSWWWMKKRSR